MKKKLLLFGSLIVILFSSFYLTPQTATAAECKITSAKFKLGANTSNSVNYFFTDDASQPEVTLSIAGENCNEQVVNVSLIEGGIVNDSISPLSNQQFMFPQQGDLEIVMRAGETGCLITSDPDCEYSIKVTVYNPTLKQITQTFTDSALLKFNCSPDGCWKPWEFISDNQPENSPHKICRVTKAWFDPHMSASTTKKAIEDFFFDSNKPKVNIHVQTNHCIGKTIEVSVLENDHGYFYDSTNTAKKDPQGNSTDDAISVLDDKDFVVDQDEHLTVTLRSGEDECEQKTTAANDTIGISGVGIDCEYYIEVFYPTTDGKGSFVSIGKSAGLLAYECEATCDEAWGFVGDSITANQEAAELEALQGLTDPNSACKGDPDCYELFGGLSDALGDKLKTIKPTSLGDFINTLIAFAIGIAGVVLFVRIFILGFQFINEKKAGKSNELADTKEEILKAVGGFILVLCIFLILRTINPDLLNLTPRIDALSLLSVPARVNDPNFIETTNALDTSNITVDTNDYTDEVFLAYLYHQQGPGGAPSILWAAQKNYASIPASTPFIKNNGKTNATVVNANMKGNVNPSDMQKVIGTSTITPKTFLAYWRKKVEAAKKSNNPIPAEIDTGITQVASDLSIGKNKLIAMCRIESGCNTKGITIVNASGFTGLFQLSQSVFDTYKKGGNIKSVYDNAYVAGKYMLDNLKTYSKNKKYIYE